MRQDILKSLPKGAKIVSDDNILKSLPEDIKIESVEPAESVNPYYSNLNKEDQEAKLNEIVNNIPDLDDTKKQIYKELALKRIPQPELSSALLTLQGKHPNQDGGNKYYYNAKGVPVPIKNDERPPKGFNVANDLYGTQDDANDDNIATSAGKHVVNGLIKGALGVEGLINLPYALATGEDADWYKSQQNAAEYLSFKTADSEKKGSLFNSEDMKGIEDFFDPNRYDFSSGTVRGSVLNGMESVISFLVGTKGAGTLGKIAGSAGKGAGLLKAGSVIDEAGVVAKQGSVLTDIIEGTSSAGAKAKAFGGAFGITYPEVSLFVEDAGIEGREGKAVAAAFTVPIALTEMLFGTEGLFVRNEAAKSAKSQMIKGLVGSIKKDANGNITKEAIGDLFKETTLEATKLSKSFAREVGENIAEEAGTEALQDLEKKGMGAMYDYLSQQDSFKEDPFSIESFGEYWNSALNGAAGAGGMSIVATAQKRKQEIQKRQSESIFNTVQQGPEAITVLNKNIGKAVEDGEITAEQGAEAYYKVDQYTKYNELTKELNLNEEDKRRVFDLTFEKSNLETQIPTNYEIEKLNAIEQGVVNSKKKKAKDIQDEIDKIILRDDVQNTAGTTAKKTEEQVAKDQESELEKLKQKTPVKSTKGEAIFDEEPAPKDFKYKESQSIKNEKRSYDDIPNQDWNNPKFDTRVKQYKLAEKIDSAPDKRAIGVIQEDNQFVDAKGHKVDTFNVTLPDGKSIRFASSMVRRPAKDEKGGYRGNTYEENFDNRDNPIGAQVGLKVVTLKDSGRKVVFIYNNEPGPKKGKHIGMVKESMKGNSNYTQADLDEMADLRMTNMAEEGGETVTETEPVKPISPADVKLTKPKVVLGVPSREKHIADEIQKLKEGVGEYDPSINYEAIFGKDYDVTQAGGKKLYLEKLNTKIETPKEEGVSTEDVLRKVNLYNQLSKTSKKSEQGVKLYNAIREDAESLNGSVSVSKSGKLSVINEGGKKIIKKGVKRSDDVIAAEKYDKKEAEESLKMIPMSIDHMVIMDVASGEQFNIASLKEVGDNVDEIPSLFKITEGGIDIRDYKQRMSEMSSLKGDEMEGKTDDVIAKEAWGTLSKYLTKGGRAAAIEEAKLIYQRSKNGGLTNAEVDRMAAELELTKKETEAITETVNNMTEDEVSASINKLEKSANATETAREIIDEANGTEEKTNNPFDENFEEEERKPSGEIIAKKPGEEDVFQKSKELEYAEGELVKAEKELSASKKAFDAKRKELDKGLIADQEDLFGERKSIDETSLFDERATVDARNEAVKPFKDRYDAAVKNYKKWQDKVASLEGTEDSQTSLFQKTAAKKANVEKIVDKLKKSIPNIKVVFDENLNAAGKWSPKNKTITINPYYAGLDTPIHEYGHILIDAMGYDNRIIQAAVKQLKGSSLWIQTENRYPELNEENLAKEVLAEAIGLEGAGIFEKESEKSRFKQFLDYIFDWFKTKLGLNKNIAKSLAKQVLSGRGVVAKELTEDQKQQGEYLELINGFYSPIEKQLSEFKLANQSATKWLNMLGKGDEVTYTGLRAFLESKKPDEQVKTKELVDFIRNNRIQIKEVALGEKKKPSNTIVAKLGVGGRNTSYTFYYVDGYGETSKLETVENPYSMSPEEAFDRWVENSGGVDELADFHDINVDEFTLFDTDYDESQDTKFHQYQLEGEKENYKEILITLPVKSTRPNVDDLAMEMFGVPYDKLGENRGAVNLESNKRAKETKIFKSSHFDEPNILVHLRMNTRTDAQGNKVLFLEEVQSDWGQQGKKEGFGLRNVESGNKFKDIVSKHEGSAPKEIYIYDGYIYYEDATGENISAPIINGVPDMNSAGVIDPRGEDYGIATQLVTGKKGTPSAPYVTDTNSWVKLGLKVALQHAVKEGATKIAWTTGEQQNERYDLSKSVNSIRYGKRDNGNYDIDYIGVNGGGEWISMGKNIPENKIEDYVGKDLSEKITSGFTTSPGGIISGVDLKVGGKGMIGFYGSPKEGKTGIIGGVAEKLFGKGSIKTTELPNRENIGGYQIYEGDRIIVDGSVAEKGRVKLAELKLANPDRSYTIRYEKPSIESATQHSIDITPEMEESVQKGLAQFQKKKETPEEKKQRKEEKRARTAEQNFEMKKIMGDQEIKDLSFDKLIKLYNHVIGYEKSIQDKYFGDIKTQIAYRLFTEKKAQLAEWQKQGKVTGYNEEEANKSDIKSKDVLMKNLSHMTQIVPELQAFSKLFENAYFDMTAERYTLKNELQKLGKEVIKEANKKLGIVGRAREMFSSDNAKYFEYLENPNAIIGEDEDGNPVKGAGYWTVEEGKKKGFTPAQMEFLKFMHRLQDERNEQLKTMGRDEQATSMGQEVLKVDKGVAEAWRTEGLMSAFSSFLGNGFNLRNVRITYNGKNMPYGEVEKDLLAKGNKGGIDKLVALRDLFKYNMAAKRQIQKGIHVDEDNETMLQQRGGAKFGIDPHGALINKFMKNRNKDRGYSKDFYKAAFEFIDDSTHSKHMQELLPYIDSIEYLNKTGLLDEEGNVLHGVKDNVAEWISQWKDLHLFKVEKPGALGPEADAAMKFLRTLTSQLVMAFNFKAGLINIAMGQYNNFRKETAKELAVGHKRMAKDPKKVADILSKYQVISIDYDSNPKLFAGKLFDYLAHGLTRAGEYYIQGSMFIGLMTEKEYNSFEYKKNKDGVEELVLKPGVDEKALKEDMIKNKNRVSDIQGKYSEKDRRNFMAGEFGKMVSQFKVWIPDWWKERFGQEYITADGQVKKGSYRNFTLDALKDLREQVKAEGPKAIWNNKEAMTNLKGALTVAVLWSLSAAGDDDDKKRKKGDLLSQMVSNVLFVFDPSGLKFTASHPAAALGTVEKFLTVFEDVVKGDEKKFGKDLVKVIPYNKMITQVPDLLTGK